MFSFLERSTLVKNSLAYKLYLSETIRERHRHRFEFKNTYREIFNEHGMVFSGISPDNRLVEIAEIEGHPFMLGSQFHPEFLSRPNRPHPLFYKFIEASAKRAGVWEVRKGSEIAEA
jgi:CTP synthase